MTFKEKMKSFATGAAAVTSALGLPMAGILGFAGALSPVAPAVAFVGLMAEVFSGAAFAIKIARSRWNNHKPSFITGVAVTTAAFSVAGLQLQDRVRGWDQNIDEAVISALETGSLKKAFTAADAPASAVNARLQPVFAPAAPSR